MRRPIPDRAMRFIARMLSWPLALLILFEEWGWEPLQRAFMRIAHALGLQGLEQRIRRLPPYAALGVFAVPTLMLVPVKLLALWLIGIGQVMLGALVIIAAKVVGTAVVARLFTLTQPALMRLAWFARAYARWMAFKEALLRQVRMSWPWRWARVTKRRWRRAAARRQP